MPNAVVLDTNLLLLWLVGTTDLSLLRTFKRVDVFNEGDFKQLRHTLAKYPIWLTTPHVLTETSNFLNQAPPHRRFDLFAALRAFIDRHPEHYALASELAQEPVFHALGLTDAALSKLSTNTVIITTDFHLSGRIQASGGYAVNFNHLRKIALDETD